MESLKDILRESPWGGQEVEFNPERLERAKADSFNASVGNLNEDDGHECKICLNKGWIMKAYQMDNGHWNTSVRECKCMNVRRTINRMKRSGLENVIRNCTFDKFETKEDWQKGLKRIVEEWADNPDGWLFLGGNSGSGKTHLCTAACRKFLLDGKDVLYMMWRDDVVKLKNALGDRENKAMYTEMIDRFKNVEVLYIDDFFKTGKGPEGAVQRPTGGDVNVAFEILNYRYNNPHLITIISSESTPDELMEIDEAVGGRIYEKSTRATISRDPSKNYRRKKVMEF